MNHFIIKILTAFVLLSSTSFIPAEDSSKETKEQRRERLRIAVQAICPVSGKSLAGVTKPIQMTDPQTKEVFYVCCEKCQTSKSESKYLEKIRSNFAKAQGKCLVMVDNDISVESKHGIIEGHFVYVCCPPCVKKMNASPERYLDELDNRYEASLKK
jgi:hypothetical protein